MPQEQSTPSQSWLSTRWWILVIAAAIGLALWGHSARISHTSYVSNIAGGYIIAIDPNSPTGYEMGFRKLVVPEKNAEGSQWIMQVQQMFDSGAFLLRHVDYDNSPDGRSVRTSSLYRWWIAGIAWVDHLISGNSIGLSVERAALVADPILQLIALLLTATFIARYFNGWSAALFSVGFVTIFPLGSVFSPAQLGDSTLSLICSIGCVLPLVAGLSKLNNGSGDKVRKSLGKLFLIGGFVGGIGLWIGVAGALPMLIGIVIAAASAGYFYNRKAATENSGDSTPLPWRIWAIGGAAATLLGWATDRSPALFESASWQSDFAHPLYAVAWLGCGEILRLLDARPDITFRRKVITLSIAILGICGLAYTIIFHGSMDGWSIDPVGTRLTRLPINPDASGFGSWLQQQGVTGLHMATLIPASLLIVGIAALIRKKDSAIEGKMIAIALGPTVFALGSAFMELGWWSQMDGMALTLAVVVISLNQLSNALKWSCQGIVLFASMMGISFVYSSLGDESRNSVSQAELETLVERHLGQWLAKRSESTGDVALAPPNVSVSLAYYGGLQVLGTPYSENFDGFSAAVRLSSASTADEARAISAGLEVDLIVHPSWDSFLEDYARLGNESPENSFIAMLNRWLPPRWLEPVSFRLPTIPGFEDESVVVFRTVEIQDNASAIGRLVEYFLDSGRAELATRAQGALENNFPDELVTRITGSELAIAMGERTQFNRAADSIIQSIEAGGDFYLTWDFRVSMTLVLAGANRIDETKTQLERCLLEADRDTVRRLPQGSLGGLLHLAKALKMEFPDPELKEYAISLLPEEQQVGL